MELWTHNNEENDELLIKTFWMFINSGMTCLLLFG